MIKRVRCKYCDKSVRLSNIQHSYEYICPRCTNTIYRPGAPKLFVATLAFSTFIILFWALTSPLLSVYIIGNIQLSIIDTLIYLFKTNILIGIFLSLTIVVIPIFMNFITLLILYNKELQLHSSIIKKYVAIYLFIKEWNMIEVYFIGLLISMVKLYELADVEILNGFWINTIYLTLLYINLVIFNPLDFAHIHTRKPINKNSFTIVTLFLILALIFVLPSNLLPIMPTYKYSVTYDNTIVDGLMAFWNDGDIVIPMVIFFASIIIPLIKIFGLIIMMLMAKFNLFLQYRSFFTKYHIVWDKMGKYSLLDVYVVVFASAYIQYDDLVRIGIGYAIVPFSLVVIFTMVASKNFDTRTLWKKRIKK